MFTCPYCYAVAKLGDKFIHHKGCPVMNETQLKESNYFDDPPEMVVAIIEKSAGNERVGNMWLETKIFGLNTKIEDIIKWAYGNLRTSGQGRLIITIADN